MHQHLCSYVSHSIHTLYNLFYLFPPSLAARMCARNSYSSAAARSSNFPTFQARALAAADAIGQLQLPPVEAAGSPRSCRRTRVVPGPSRLRRLSPAAAVNMSRPPSRAYGHHQQQPPPWPATAPPSHAMQDEEDEFDDDADPMLPAADPFVGVGASASVCGPYSSAAGGFLSARHQVKDVALDGTLAEVQHTKHLWEDAKEATEREVRQHAQAGRQLGGPRAAALTSLLLLLPAGSRALSRLLSSLASPLLVCRRTTWPTRVCLSTACPTFTGRARVRWRRVRPTSTRW